MPSFSLVPDETDPSVLFTTAGMHPFKRYYAKPDLAPAPAIVTIQKCIRTGDIEEVGDATHLTFFEMLGNFSFGYPKKEGSYFKKEAIAYAWEFLTKELNIEISRLSATYFKGEGGIPEDKESYDIIRNITKLPEGKIVGTGKSETFWSLGTENSPGGPTVEFYIDNIEIWNLVFNEYILRNEKYEPSEYKGVDTGMGFERLLAVLNQAENVYHTDIFEESHRKLHQLFKTENPVAERIILDHLRAAVFIMADGVRPSNKGAGYVLRRLIRRAIVKAKTLGIEENFCARVATTIGHSEADPNRLQNPTNVGILRYSQDDVFNEFEKEETKFRKTLAQGLRIIKSQKEFSGKVLFDLYQTYGIPVEITIEEAERLGNDISNETMKQFNNELLAHQELSRTASAGMFKGGLADAGEETTRLHTAAHLMLAALRQVLGEEVTQKGSNITAERLRFDFNYPEKLTSEQIKSVEDIVNEKIKEDLPVTMEEMGIDDAKKSGAMGVFDDRYGDKVKVYTIGRTHSTLLRQAQDRSGPIEKPFSIEICGGPHVKRTGELGRFKIIKEESSSAGVRRIKAILE